MISSISKQNQLYFCVKAGGDLSIPRAMVQYNNAVIAYRWSGASFHVPYIKLIFLRLTDDVLQL